MAEVPSTRTLAIGAPAPDFELPDHSGAIHSLQSIRGAKGLVIVFACNHCQFVVHLARRFGEFASLATTLGFGVAAINSNDTARYPQDSPEKMAGFAQANGWAFPYLVDADQAVAKKYFAACTPDFYLFDGGLRLAYCGQLDSSRPGNGKPVTGQDFRRAIDAVIFGQPPIQPQQPSSGCNIKWKPGNEPDYFQ